MAVPNEINTFSKLHALKAPLAPSAAESSPCLDPDTRAEGRNLLDDFQASSAWGSRGVTESSVLVLYSYSA